MELYKLVKHRKSFEDLYSKTLKDGSPNLTNEFESSLKFESINLDAGDILVFDNRCPHRSQKNNSDKSRRILYYTTHQNLRILL